jgi:LysM repeat protein
MLKRFLLLPVLALAWRAGAQTTPEAAEVAGLREDVNGLSQRVGELTLRVEQLEAENAKLRAQAQSPDQAYATLAQLNAAVAALNKAIDEAGRRPAEAPKPAEFSDDFPKEGITYTVRTGDTLATIARRTGARISDIINANKIADPSHIQAGESLFIPGGK